MLSDLITKVKNPFIKLTEDEKFQLKEIENSVKKDIKAFAVMAKELYADLRYQKLKKEFERVYQQCMNLIIYYDTKDPQEYIMKMREYQIQARVLKSIFDTPEGFIKQEEKMGAR